MWKYNGRTIRVGKAWVDDNGIQHPPNWHIWSPSDKAAAGVTEVVEETPPDSRLYTWSMGSDGKITKTAKSLADVNEVDGNGDPLLDDEGNQVVTRGVKWNLKQEVKNQQGALLAQTPATREEPFLERGFWDDLMENPGEYSYALIAFLVLGYFLWRVQGLDRDD